MRQEAGEEDRDLGVENVADESLTEGQPTARSGADDRLILLPIPSRRAEGLNAEVDQVSGTGELDRGKCARRGRDHGGEPQRCGHHPKEDADVDPKGCHHGRTTTVHEGVSRDQRHVHAGRDHDDGCNGEKRTDLHRPMIASPSRAGNSS